MEQRCTIRRSNSHQMVHGSHPRVNYDTREQLGSNANPGWALPFGAPILGTPAFGDPPWDPTPPDSPHCFWVVVCVVLLLILLLLLFLLLLFGPTVDPSSPPTFEVPRWVPHLWPQFVWVCPTPYSSLFAPVIYCVKNTPLPLLTFQNVCAAFVAFFCCLSFTAP